MQTKKNLWILSITLSFKLFKYLIWQKQKLCPLRVSFLVQIFTLNNFFSIFISMNRKGNVSFFWNFLADSFLKAEWFHWTTQVIIPQITKISGLVQFSKPSKKISEKLSNFLSNNSCYYLSNIVRFFWVASSP